MKKLPSLFAALIIMLVCFGAANLNAQGWNFVKLFPSNTFQTHNGSGLNNAITVDPMGRLWVASYTTTDSTITSSLGSTAVGKVWVFNPNGTQASFSPMVVLNGVDGFSHAVHDTLNGNLLAVYPAKDTNVVGFSSTTGMRTGPDGNIYLTKGSSIIWKLNYHDGTVLQRVYSPIAGFYAPSGAKGSASTFCSISDDGEVFVGPVYPGGNIVAIPANFGATQDPTADVTLGVSAGFGRSLVVSHDGHDVYLPRYDVHETFHYQGDVLSGYTLKDTLFLGLTGTATAWDPRTGYLWLTAGGTDGAASLAPWLGGRLYGFDMSNRSHPVLKDSLVYDTTHTVFTHAQLEVRDIGFSPTGDTVYVGIFSHDTTGIEMFRSTILRVEPLPGLVANNYTLSQNFPNPFNPSTEIRFSIANTGMTTLKVYDVLGREVASLVNQELAAGSYKATFDASRLASGTYIYELRSGEARITKKMMLLK